MYMKQQQQQEFSKWREVVNLYIFSNKNVKLKNGGITDKHTHRHMDTHTYKQNDETNELKQETKRLKMEGKLTKTRRKKFNLKW